MSKVNQIVINKENYNTTEDFENAIKKAVMVLLDNDYIMTIKYDEKGLGIVVINYNYANQCYGNRYPIWLLPEEEETVVYVEEE